MLRQFFRQEYISFHSRPSQDSFMESYVDRRIDRFLEDSGESLKQVRRALEECRLIRQRLLELEADEISRELRREYRDSFRELGEQTGSLRKQLASVLPPTLRYKSDFNPRLRAEEPVRWLGRELDEISERLSRLEKHVENFLFGSRPVVDVEDLGDGDILVLLFEMRKLCRLAEGAVMDQSRR